MNWKRFKEIADKKSYNSNNAWGFGGKAGKIYSLNVQENNFEYQDLKSYCRHIQPSSTKAYLVNGKRVTKKEFETQLEALLRY